MDTNFIQYIIYLFYNGSGQNQSTQIPQNCYIDHTYTDIKEFPFEGTHAASMTLWECPCVIVSEACVN